MDLKRKPMCTLKTGVFGLLCLVLSFSLANGVEWRTWGSSRYYFGSNTKSWSNARVSCERLDAKLAIITSAEENSFLKDNMLARQEYWIGLRQGNLRCTCAGVSQSECTTCRESWTWYDLTPMDYYEWYEEGQEPQYNPCGRLTVQGWREIRCSRAFPYICERHLCADVTCEVGKCTATNGTARCQCHEGYSHPSCEADADECVSSPCLHGSSCVDLVNGYRCVCLDGYHGSHCEQEDSSSKNNGTHYERGTGLPRHVLVVIIVIASSLSMALVMVFCVCLRRSQKFHCVGKNKQKNSTGYEKPSSVNNRPQTTVYQDLNTNHYDVCYELGNGRVSLTGARNVCDVPTNGINNNNYDLSYASSDVITMSNNFTDQIDGNTDSYIVMNGKKNNLSSQEVSDYVTADSNTQNYIGPYYNVL